MDYIDPPVDVLGLSGKAGSGKNFLSKVVVRDAGFVPIALALHFKLDCVVQDGMDIDEVFGEQEKSPETRTALQLRGTEQGRDVYGEDVWVRYSEALMRYFRELGASKFVVTDVRFPNEANWIKSLGGKVYRITGRGGEKGEQAQHISETALDNYHDFDRYIDNSPDREKQAVGDLIKFIKEDFIGE